MDWAMRILAVYVIVGEALLTFCLLVSRGFRDALRELHGWTLVIVVAWVVLLWPRCMWKAVRA